MNKFWLLGNIIVVIIIFFTLLYSQGVFKKELPPVPEDALYKNATATTDARINDLLSYMTLEEKIGQMALVEKNSILSPSDISTYGLGALLSGFGGKPEDNSIEGWKNMVDAFIVESNKSRLGIPILYGVDAMHGHSNVPGFIVFPHAIGLGATGDAQLVKKVAQATKDQIIATHINWSYSPTYDMPQDIRWGRVYETFSDDPELVSDLASAYIEGLQENTTDATNTIQVLATPKHFIGVGSMLWNTSRNEDFKIDQGTTLVNMAKLRDDYLPPYKKAVDNGALSIMVGLNSWGDTKLAAEQNLIQTVLKDELGFSGFVVSDWYGVYEIFDDTNDYESTVSALNAGVDMVMLPFDYKQFIKNVKRAVNNGDIIESRIDDAVRRILKAKFALGLFDEALQPEAKPIDLEAHKALARTAVAQSSILLKNDARTLPIPSNTKNVFVAGSAADNIGMQAGAWTIEWQGIDGNWLPEASSILDGIKSVAHSDTTVVYDAEAQFGIIEEKADIGIAVVGEKPYAEGWGDNENPTLSNEDIETISRLSLASEKLVVVLVTGRPLIITDELSNWNALVVAWLPGSEGGGVADVLFGKQSFTGKLPLPWPATVQQLPITTTGQTADGTPVLFERYFGLQ